MAGISPQEPHTSQRVADSDSAPATQRSPPGPMLLWLLSIFPIGHGLIAQAQKPALLSCTQRQKADNIQ